MSIERQLTITAAEWASVEDGTLWLVREGDECDRCWHGGAAPHAPTCARSALPPVEFVQACATCPIDCTDGVLSAVFGRRGTMPCPDCRIELVGSCPTCDGEGVVFCADDDDIGDGCANCEGDGTVTLGHAYAVGQPLPIVERLIYDGSTVVWVHDGMVMLCGPVPGEANPTGPNWHRRSITDHLAHAGPPESLVGKWAMELKVVGS